MTQKPFAARNSDNGCLRGVEGMPSHSTTSVCFFLGRKAGRNSATISFLNLVRNMTPHYLLLAVPTVVSGIMAGRCLQTHHFAGSIRPHGLGWYTCGWRSSSPGGRLQLGVGFSERERQLGL